MTSSTTTKATLFILTTAGASSAMTLPAASPVPSGTVVRVRSIPSSSRSSTVDEEVVRAIERDESTSAKVTGTSAAWVREDPSSTNMTEVDKVFWARSIDGNSTFWARSVDGNSTFWARDAQNSSSFWARNAQNSSSFWAVRDTSTTTTTTADPALTIQEKDTTLATQQTTIVALSLVLAFVLIAPLVGYTAYRFNKRRLSKIDSTSAGEDTEKGVDPAALTSSQSVRSETSVPPPSPPVYGAQRRDSSWREASEEQGQLNHAGYI